MSEPYHWHSEVCCCFIWFLSVAIRNIINYQRDRVMIFCSHCLKLNPYKLQNVCGNVTYLVVPLNTYQHQDVQVAGDAEKEEVKQKLTDSMCQSWTVHENDHADRQAEQAEEVRHGQVEEEALRDGGAVQTPAEFHYHADVCGDTEQATERYYHTGNDVPGMEAGGRRSS